MFKSSKTPLTFTVTVSVAPTTVDIPVPPATSNVLPSPIVWFEPESPVSVKLLIVPDDVPTDTQAEPL